MSGTYTAWAVAAVIAAARSEHDFTRWLARMLAAAAGQLGGSDELVIGRPGSWEASHVRGLLADTVGSDDECLSDYRAGCIMSGVVYLLHLDPPGLDHAKHYTRRSESS